MLVPFKGQMIEVELLKAPITLRPTDLYLSESDRWETCFCPGLLLEEGCETIWVRPKEIDSTPAPA